MRRFTTLAMLLLTLLALTPSAGVQAAVGVSAEYTVKVTPPEPAAMAFAAVYRGASSPLRLTIGLPSWPMDLTLLKELRISTLSGQPLSFAKVDGRTLSVAVPADGAVVATWLQDLQQATDRGKKVESFGGKLSGYESLLVPENQAVTAAKCKFDLPAGWSAVSSYPRQDGWHQVTPTHFADLRLELQASGWYFGTVDLTRPKPIPMASGSG
ncbi:MAG TPA: hypothetical protein VD969_21430 [Symbiobacteriaceae bacterium]|nr:hypothetical protein [Symbiobacteriaceae bacterium]